MSNFAATLLNLQAILLIGLPAALSGQPGGHDDDDSD